MDVRSGRHGRPYYLEDVATEFLVQGLELDWGCVVWDADFRYEGDQGSTPGWKHWSFRGSRWERILQPERQLYLKNAYRVLLTWGAAGGNATGRGRRGW